ncbi:DMT family transporter [Halomonas sp. McH1-25]|uniref:DMT family transporter n=1 Tax=unclassified Halomonas TaxID=2609666 RepID=UPI001EF5A319|nr:MULTISPECIES: DMT family transporter [unclassified Halomonas]MCG7601504.1 DMT family transporter [Halomonas sp. McH1-25]MCP1343945.1 DMT family transporter [Halomonas sp. FL8]MCP1361520.1 DMT family transporter [Halomonas sp. BBD45]MCP1363771.1 DMT family transporter [Halomonas sp. BBD48]
MPHVKVAKVQASKRAIVTDVSVLGVAIVWGSSYVAMQEVGKYLDVQTFLAARFLFSLPILLYLFSGNLIKISKLEIGIGFFLGLFLFAILSLETTGVKYTSAANAGFLIAVSVVLVPLFERIIGGVEKRAAVYLLAILALVGCYLLSKPTYSGVNFVFGDYIILFAAVVRGLQIFLFGHLTKGVNVSTTNITLVELSLVAVLASFSTFFIGHVEDVDFTVIPNYVWLVVIYLGVVGTSFAFLAQLNAAQKTSSTRVALILSTEPVFAAFFAWMIAGETISSIQLLGGVLIFISAFLGRLIEA